MDNALFRLVLHDLFESTGSGFDKYAWEPFHNGVEICWLYGQMGESASAALLRYAPGARIPEHIHTGYEHILVLQGSQQDEQDEYFPGTLLVNGPGTCHSIASERGCIVLIIWEKPVDMCSC